MRETGDRRNIRDAVDGVHRDARAFRCETRDFVQGWRFERHWTSSASSARTLHIGRLFELPAPADRLLETFDRTQPVSGAQIIVLSEHVDYWNRLGWTDPFSSALFTQRQQDYVTQFHLDSAYTPQLVVDGQKDVVGSDERAARAAILKAETQVKESIDLRARRSGADAKVEIGVVAAARKANIYVALADDHAQSQVTRGENSGHTLRHVAVVRTLLLAGKTDAQGAFTKDLTLPLKDGDNGSWRVVVFLQESGSKRVVGAAQTRL